MESQRTCSRALFSAALALIALGGFSAAQEVPDGRVNILLIMADQHNAHALGCYGNGFGGVDGTMTPNLDRLAEEGVRFTNAFVASPQCQPSRYSLLTGRWPHFHGLQWNGIWEPRTYETFPSLARKAGYTTLSTGKAHLVITDQPEPIDDFGFDQFFKKHDYFQFCQDHGQQSYNAVGNFWSMPDLPGKIDEAGFTFNTNEFHRTGYYTERALDFLEARAADGAPFLCWFQPPDPHAGLLPTGPADPQDWAHLYHPFADLDLPPNFDTIATTQLFAEHQEIYSGLTPDEWREILSYYYGLVTQVDYNVGRVLTRLEELGLAENTLVIYTADHGELGSEMRTWTKGRFHYDSINRVPLIMRLPGILPAGRVIDSLVSNVDLFPTFAELTGIPISDARRAQVDGTSLLDLMLVADEPAGWRQEVFAELGIERWGKTQMVRTKDAKYTYGSRDDEEELYDLALDPWETDNVVSDPAYATLLADLRDRLATWLDGGTGHTPDYPTTGKDNPPKVATVPFPRAGAVDVDRHVDLGWVPTPSAETQRVYMGVDADSLPLVADLVQMEASFNPGALAPARTYYWRVDGINQNGVGVGEVWSFETEVGGTGGPRPATTPEPAQRATGVDHAAHLSWVPDGTTTSQVVHFGVLGQTAVVTPLPGSQATYDPGWMPGGVTYEWRVDQTSGAGTTEGTVWRFTVTEAGLPARAGRISPLHLDPLVSDDGRTLEWLPGAGADYHDVYFGEDFPLAHQGRFSAVQSFDPGPLAPRTVYYWRIDEGNSFGSVVGETWRFQAAPEPIGTVYCDPANPNTTGLPGRMQVSGSTQVALDDLVLIARQLPQGPNIGYFLMGTGTQSTTPPGSAGPLCITPGLRRYLPPVCDTGELLGGFARVVGTSGPISGHITAGSTWNFQAWHRDGGNPSNLTNAVSVTFQ